MIDRNKLELGKVYRIRLTDGHWTDGEFRGVTEHGPNWAHSRTVNRYHFLNLATGRYVEIKSTIRIKEKSL